MNEENSSPIKTGKGCRKRTNNTKYFNEIDDESEDMEPVIKKLKASGPKITEANRSANLASMIKEKLAKQSQPDKDGQSCDDNDCRHKKENILLKEYIKILERENKRLLDEIENGN
ncbi:Hypothetical predicted protein, partial [Paramuricea clavata]